LCQWKSYFLLTKRSIFLFRCYTRQILSVAFAVTATWSIGRLCSSSIWRDVLIRLSSPWDVPRHRFVLQSVSGLGQVKFADGGLILGSSQFTQMPQLPLKMTLVLKKVKRDSKIIISFPLSKSVHMYVKKTWFRV